MSLKPGDTVRFLNEVGGGRIVKMIDNDKASVFTEYGFEIPVRLKDMIKIESDDYRDAVKEEPKKMVNHKSQSVVEEVEEDEPVAELAAKEVESIFYPDGEINDTGNPEIQVFYAFVPTTENNADSDMHCYLINDSVYTLFYNYLIQIDEQTFSQSAGVLESNTKVLLKTYKRDELNDLTDAIFQMVFYAKGKYKLQKPQQVEMEINPVKFYKETSFRENDFFDENALIFQVLRTNQMLEAAKEINTKEIEKALREKEALVSKPVKKPKDENVTDDILEVDLHINELLETNKGMSNAEMIDVQMQHFRSKLDEARTKKIKKVVFIHGVGNGKLKMEIRKALESEKIVYHDASFREYGYGATLAIIRQNSESKRLGA